MYSDILLSTPIIILSVGALLLLMLEVFVQGWWPKSGVALAVLGAALLSYPVLFAEYLEGGTVFSGVLYADPFGMVVSALIIVATLLAVLVGSGSIEKEGIDSPAEYYSLMIMSVIGGVVMVSSAELITFVLGLEIMSMPLYCLCGAALGRKESSEAALKYFLLGSFASAFLLYGIALLYGLTGSTSIEVVGSQLSTGYSPVLLLAVGLVLVGLIFKIGLVPFHFWTPDVYQGAPTSVTAFMACAVKAAAIGGALRLLWIMFGGISELWIGAIWLIAACTMVVGNIVALRQRSLKRMLAYSSIGHAGYLLIGFLAPGVSHGGGSAIIYYLLGYTVMTLGAFGVVLGLGLAGEADATDSDDISRMNGFGYTNPFLGAMMALFMLSLAGIPPGMVGLLGKFYIFSAGIKSGYLGLAIIGVLCAAVSVYYYLRVVVAMYFVEPEAGVAKIAAPGALRVALVICAIGVVFLGICPSWFHSMGELATQFK